MSTNISNKSRQDLLNKIGQIRSYLESDSTGKANQLLVFLVDLEKDIDGKKYGLVFEEHEEQVDRICANNIPILVEETQLKIKRGGIQNFIIEGDNLACLKLLEKTHSNRIDCIIIDPPYNRGLNDFMYDDNYVAADDKFKHSKWLSFMEKRLRCAHKILAKHGVIFINIDDNELAQLKILCDEIFGDKNFISCFPWHNRTSMQNDTDISINHEYIVVYAKNRRQSNRRLKPSNMATWFDLDSFVFQPKQIDDSAFSNPDNDPRGKWKADPFDAPAVRENLTYEITNPNTGKKYLPPKGRHWRTEEAKYKALLLDNRIVFGKTGNSKPQLKVFYNEIVDNGQVCSSWFDADVYGTSTEGKKELLEILHDKDIFDTPKPTRLYYELLKLALSPKRQEPIILDFFAGSGTTGESVMQYNAMTDNPKASFILCTNNQNNICRDITYERIKRVIVNKNYNASLKYMKVDFVPIDEQLYYEYADKLLLHIKELVELENGVDFENNDKAAICLTDDELSSFALQLKNNKSCSAVYVGHNVLLTPEIEKMLTTANVNIKIIPDYYYGELRG